MRMLDINYRMIIKNINLISQRKIKNWKNQIKNSMIK